MRGTSQAPEKTPSSLGLDTNWSPDDVELAVVVDVKDASRLEFSCCPLIVWSLPLRRSSARTEDAPRRAEKPRPGAALDQTAARSNQTVGGVQSSRYVLVRYWLASGWFWIRSATGSQTSFSPVQSEMLPKLPTLATRWP